MSIVLFLLVLFVLVLVHEWGHYIVAKKTGMRVDEFAIGFPPKLFGIKKGETEFSFNAFPIGGFVRIFGENAEAPQTEADRRDVGRSFHARPKWAQILVLLAGITMNILFAWFLFTVTQIIGQPVAIDEAAATDAAVLYVAGVLPEAPADGVLPVGSAIVSAHAGGATLEHPTPSSFSEFVNTHAQSDISVSYRLGSKEKTITLKPVAGMVKDEPEKYIVGTSLSLVEIQKKPIHLAIGYGFMMTVNGFVDITVGLASLISDAFAGEADFTHIAGPVGIVGMVGDAAAFGLVALLTFTAVISLNLAVINLLPFPALDGGRVVFVLIELITRRQVPPVWTGWINLLGFVLLMIMMAAVTWNDIARLF
jgi:regulator of sigma E protease